MVWIRTVLAAALLTGFVLGSPDTAHALGAASRKPCGSYDPMPPVLAVKAAKLYEQPQRWAPVVGVLYGTDPMTVGANVGGWTQVIDRRTHVHGWISADYIGHPARICISAAQVHRDLDHKR